MGDRADGAMTLRSGLRSRHNVERIRDERIDRVGDQQARHDKTEKYSDLPE